VTTTLTHRYAPRGSAQALFACKAARVLVSGPAGTGKSRACLEKMHLAMKNVPGAKGLIVRRTQESLTKSALPTFENHVAEADIEAGAITWFGGSGREAAGYRYDNGSAINVGGMDKPDKILSTEYDIIYVQEANEISEESWGKLGTRLRNWKMSYQQLMADCNPTYPTHWLKELCNQGKCVELVSTHQENPRLYNADGTETPQGKDYLQLLRETTPLVVKLRLYDGLWVAAEGIVFEGWSDAVHLIAPFEIPQDWPRYWVVDFGFVNPFVCQWWAEDHDGRMFMYREIYRTKRLVEDHAKDMLAQVRDEDGSWTESRPSKIICDHDAEDRATLKKHLGMGTHAARKDVSRGIQAVASRLKVLDDGKPRLYIFKGARCHPADQNLVKQKKPTCTAEEIPRYMWDPKKDAPVKENDHGCDCIRYKVADKDIKKRLVPDDDREVYI